MIESTRVYTEPISGLAGRLRSRILRMEERIGDGEQHKPKHHEHAAYDNLDFLKKIVDNCHELLGEYITRKGRDIKLVSINPVTDLMNQPYSTGIFLVSGFNDQSDKKCVVYIREGSGENQIGEEATSEFLGRLWDSNRSRGMIRTFGKMSRKKLLHKIAGKIR